MTHLAASTHSTLRLPGGHQKPSGHRAAAWEGRGQSLGLVGLCRRRMRVEWVWDCKGVKTLDGADEGTGRDVSPRVATATLGAWDGPDTAASSRVLPTQNFPLPPAEMGENRGKCPSPGVPTLPTLPTLPGPARCSCCSPLAAEIHVAHVHEANFCSWCHSDMAFGSSHISEGLHPRLSIPLLQGAGQSRGVGGVSVRRPFACVMQKVRQDDNFPFQF